MNSGSPNEPGSLVRSSTATARVAAGNAASSASAGKGWNSRTCATPTFSPRAVRYATVCAAVCAPEPIRTSTRSASGSPVYSTRWYCRPVRPASTSMAPATASGIRA